MSENLTGLQEKFALEYTRCFNATEAARLAGYSGDDRSLAVIGHENLRKLKIRTKIDTILKQQTISPNEVLSRLSAFATVDLSDFMEVGEFTGFPRISFEKAKKLGKIHTLKKIKFNKAGFVESIELHDPQSALHDLAVAYGLLKQRIEIDWRSKAIEDIKAGEIDYKTLVEAFDPDLATELFKLAGVPVE